VTVRLLALAGVVLAELACVAPASRPTTEHKAVVPAEPGVCAREAQSVVGEPAIEANTPVNAPGHDNAIVRLPPNTMLTSGWSGELLIDKTGRVVRVWPTARSSTRPAGVPIDTLMVEAMLTWRYQPVLAFERAVPACLGLVIFIN
jgi:hypothetical protein